MDTGEKHFAGAICKLHFQNDALFPIRYVIDEIEFILNNSIHLHQTMTNLGAEIPANSPTEISTPALNCAAPLQVGAETIGYEGRVRFTLRYGRSKREKIPLRHQMHIWLALDYNNSPRVEWRFDER